MKATVNLEEYRKTGNYPHFIGIWTIGCQAALSSNERELIEWAFNCAPKGDHFYSLELDGRKIYIAYNGELGYTAMLPEEY